MTVYKNTAQLFITLLWRGEGDGWVGSSASSFSYGSFVGRVQVSIDRNTCNSGNKESSLDGSMLAEWRGAMSRREMGIKSQSIIMNQH